MDGFLCGLGMLWYWISMSIFLDYELVSNFGLFYVGGVVEMLSAARNVQSVIEHCVDVKQNMSTTINKLQAESAKTRSMCDKAKEENDILCSSVFKLETELEASQNQRDEMGFKSEDNRAKEDEWNEREAELSKQNTAFIKDHEAVKDILSASEIKSLFNKINRIAIPFANVGAGGIEPHDIDPSKKLFYIVDGVNELLDQITLSRQALEVEHLKEEFDEAIKYKKDSEKMKKELFELSIGFEHIISKFGVGESIGREKSADVAALLPVLERLIQGIVSDSENSKVKAQDLSVKLLETQKVAEELASKVKLLEDFDQSRTCSPDTIRVTETSSLSMQSDI